MPWSIVCLMLSAAAGCTQDDALSSPTAAKMRRVARVYLDLAAAKGVGPASEQQLRTHARNVPVFDAALGGTDPLMGNQPLTSERDGEALMIRYGVGISLSRDGDAPPIVLERTGEDGYVLVAYADGSMECVTHEKARAWIGEHAATAQVSANAANVSAQVRKESL